MEHATKRREKARGSESLVLQYPRGWPANCHCKPVPTDRRSAARLGGEVGCPASAVAPLYADAIRYVCLIAGPLCVFYTLSISFDISAALGFTLRQDRAVNFR